MAKRSSFLAVMVREFTYSRVLVSVLTLIAASALDACAATPTPQPPVAALSAPVAIPLPSATPASMRLSIESRPAGAIALLDGTPRGATPLEIEGLVLGEHKLRLSLPGYEDYEASLTLGEADSRRVEVALSQIAVPTAAPSPTAGPIYPIAVMVENSWDARPQSGLAEADVLYEAPAEGGISRFMAVYVGGVPETIGPVRSARHYFVYLAAEFNASYVHIGASPQGYGALRATGLINLDETYGDPGFWRVGWRAAPHNAYTSVDVLKAALDRVAKVDPGGLAGFKFLAEAEPVEGEDAPEVYVRYPGGDRLKYVYSPEEKRYLRFMNGAPHRDAGTEEQIAPRNLVVQVVDTWVIDDVGRLDMEQLGEGRAVFFRDGVAVEGSWRKDSYGDVTEWLDAAGNPVKMLPGKIFVQVIPDWSDVEW